MNQVPDIPANADLQNLEFYSREDFLCADLGCEITYYGNILRDLLWGQAGFRPHPCTGCNHELRRNQRKRWRDVTLFDFNEANKLGEGGFGHV